MAREAFDELKLPSDADERVELEKKEAEVRNGSSSSSSEEKLSVILPTPPKSAPLPTTMSALPGKKKPQGLIGKQMAKFQKEKRASSLPNVKKVDGTASPRHRSPMVQHDGDVAYVPGSTTKAKRKRSDSIGYTSSESEDQAEKRKRGSSVEPRNHRPSPPLTSPSASRGRARKLPPPELKINGHHTHVRDPEMMRDRYEELFPAYEQLTKRLARLHKAAEGGQEVEVRKEEVEKMVGKWTKWHEELADIRMWFGEAG